MLSLQPFKNQLLMIDPVFCLFPIAGGAIGLAAGSLLPRYLLKTTLERKWPTLSQDMARFISTKLVSGEEILSKFAARGSYQKLLPVIEHHIDEFLRDRLKIAIPMIGMLIGERTIAQLKTVFMGELEVIFPQVLAKYVSDLGEQVELEPEIEKMLIKVTPCQLTSLLWPRTRKMFGLFGLITGLLAGVGNSIIFAFLY